MIAKYQWKLDGRQVRRAHHEAARAHFSLIGITTYFFSKSLILLVHFLTLSYGSIPFFLQYRAHISADERFRSKGAEHYLSRSLNFL